MAGNRRIVLTLIFILGASRLAFYLWDFSINTLQVDFSAFYTAGEALNNGLSPYQNHIQHSPPVWDGINNYQHSRFLYPPLVAHLFQPIALIPYFYAKTTWGVLSLVFLFLSLRVAFKIFSFRTFDQTLLLGICVFLYYPLLTHLERGQIDALTLLFLTISIYFMTQTNVAKQLLAGFILSAAVLIKLHTVYFLPFLFIRKRWLAITGFIIGASIIFLATLAPPGGKTLFNDYLFNQLPRIANYGQPGHGDILLDQNVILSTIESAPQGYTVKDGRFYQPVSLNFVGNATLVRKLHDTLASFGWDIGHTELSLAIFSLMFLGLLTWQYNFFPVEETSPEREFLYWMAILTVILLSAPLTHVMNTVWLLPLFVSLIAGCRTMDSKTRKSGFAFIIFGMLWIGMPDPLIFPSRPANDKYLIGELLVLTGCLVILGNHCIRKHLQSNALSLLMSTEIPAWFQSFPNCVPFGTAQRERCRSTASCLKSSLHCFGSIGCGQALPINLPKSPLQPLLLPNVKY